ncbi:MAG: hypothetical protein LBB43_03605 [Spirochaetaceae bacterium]|jgi:hypothetical protein|nr:hypothetical protein [Spirochaetaceae bacterium]
MLNLIEEKEKLTQKLSEQYSQNMISMEEYERLLEYINKIETRREINIIEKIIQENNDEDNKLTIVQNNEITIPKTNEKNLSMFSWRTINLEPINGNGGKFTSLFGTNRIIVNNLPKGRTIIKVNSIFGLTEIIVSQKVKIINKTLPIFAGIFAPNEITKEGEKLPELYIVGKAVFGNITIRTIKEVIEETKKEKEFEEKYKEKVMQNIYDKLSKKK